MKKLVLVALALSCSLAFAEEFKKCEVIAAGGGQIPNGENLDCGQGPRSPLVGGPLDAGTVKCATATVRVPVGYVIQGTPAATIEHDWRWAAKRSGPDAAPQPDGSTLVSVSAKNWSHNWTRELCVIVQATKG